MIFQIRQYQIKPDSMPEWLNIMRDTVIPFQVSKGAKVVACFVSEDDPNAFVWIRRFNDQGELAEVEQRIYEDEEWVNHIRPSFGDLMQSKDVRVVRALDFSPIQ